MTYTEHFLLGVSLGLGIFNYIKSYFAKGPVETTRIIRDYYNDAKSITYAGPCTTASGVIKND